MLVKAPEGVRNIAAQYVPFYYTTPELLPTTCIGLSFCESLK